MIVQRGLVGKTVWEPGTYATDIMVAAYDAYLRGCNVSASRKVIYEHDQMLHVSFGRQKGHTDSIIRFLRDVRPDLDYKVVVRNQQELRRIQREFPRNGAVVALATEERTILSAAPDVLFLDLGFSQFSDSMGTLLRKYLPYVHHGTKIISVMSDGLETHNWVHPVEIEIEADAALLMTLDYVDLDIAKYLRHAGQ